MTPETSEFFNFVDFQQSDSKPEYLISSRTKYNSWINDHLIPHLEYRFQIIEVPSIIEGVNYGSRLTSLILNESTHELKLNLKAGQEFHFQFELNLNYQEISQTESLNSILQNFLTNEWKPVWNEVMMINDNTFCHRWIFEFGESLEIHFKNLNWEYQTIKP